MSRFDLARRCFILGCCVSLSTAGCAFQGLNSLSLPGAVGRGPDALTYHVEMANVGTLESNSPVLVNDVVVGAVGKMTVKNWHADVEVSLRPDVVIPANAVATVGQTSLLGSMHLALDSPLDQTPQERLPPGATIPLTSSSTYPSTERTLSTLSAVVNAGGLGQIGDLVHGFAVALDGRQGDARELIGRLNTFVGIFDDQRTDVVVSIEALNRLAGTLAAQRDVLTRALHEIPPALDVLIAQRPQITTALDTMRVFSDTAAALVKDTQADLVTNLTNLEPTVRALADVGPEIDTVLAFLPVLPFGQNLIDRGIRGDYMNLFAVADLTVPRLKRTLFVGTRWGDEHAQLVPAPGDPGYDAFYNKNPLTAPLEGLVPADSLEPDDGARPGTPGAADTQPQIVRPGPAENDLGIPKTPPAVG
jgi:phospholipid/cholesterol/gamma-HCH transport system substrate-binding protein